MLADGKFQCFADRFVIEILHHQLIERTCDTKKHVCGGVPEHDGENQFETWPIDDG